MERVQFIASDHSPAPATLKSSPDFFEAWGGIPGVQSTLTSLCSKIDCDLEIIARLTSGAVAWRFDIANKGAIRADIDADVALVDLSARTPLLTRGDLLDRHKLSPYVGRLPGRMIRRTILRGHTIFADGKTVGPPIGRFVRPNRAGSTR
jgi:allantoinase